VAEPRVEILVRTTVPDLLAGVGEVVKIQTLREVIDGAYRWGQVDGQSRAEGKPYSFEGRGYSMVGVKLDDLRATFPNENRPAVEDEGGVLSQG